jgi:hypothetical protein
MSLPTVTLSLHGVPHVNVPCPRALLGGVIRIIGKTYDASAGGYALSEHPTRYVLSKREARDLGAFFAKLVRHGELRPADLSTAEALGVPFPPTAAGVTDG